MKPKSKLLARVQAFMRGRYGQNDTLNRCLNYLALILVVVSLWRPFHQLVWLAVLLIILSYWRLFSKKIYRQVAINRGFQRFFNPVARPFRRLGYQISQHRHYRFFRCQNCQQRIRIPKHHGRVRITCPSCGTKFEART